MNEAMLPLLPANPDFTGNVAPASLAKMRTAPPALPGSAGALAHFRHTDL